MKWSLKRMCNQLNCDNRTNSTQSYSESRIPFGFICSSSLSSCLKKGIFTILECRKYTRNIDNILFSSKINIVIFALFVIRSKFDLFYFCIHVDTDYSMKIKFKGRNGRSTGRKILKYNEWFILYYSIHCNHRNVTINYFMISCTSFHQMLFDSCVPLHWF